MKGFFIAGTDTGVGKTLVAAAMLRAFVRLGHRCVGMKPVAAGAELRDGAWANEDVLELGAAGNVPVPGELINPYLFREPIAPHIAAAHKGVDIELPRIRAACEELAQRADLVVVEGAGGLLVPLTAGRDMADLAVVLGVPVVLVVGMRLGCLNHALLSAEAMATRRLRLAGWVANRIDPDMAVYEENLAALASRLDAPMLAEIPFRSDMTPQRAAALFSPKRLQALLQGS